MPKLLMKRLMQLKGLTSQGGQEFEPVGTKISYHSYRRKLQLFIIVRKYCGLKKVGAIEPSDLLLKAKPVENQKEVKRRCNYARNQMSELWQKIQH